MLIERKNRKILIKISYSFELLQAREEFRVEKYRNKIEWAVGIIQRHYVLWKRRQYLMTLPLRFNTNSMSPVNIEWPSAPRFLIETSQLLKNIFHRWRVRLIEFKLKI